MPIPIAHATDRPSCARCGETFTPSEWDNRDDAIHTDTDGADIHAHCCPTCRAHK